MREFIEKFSSYKGAVTQYCIENNLSNIIIKTSEANFYQINLNNICTDNSDSSVKEIKINIGSYIVFIE